MSPLRDILYKASRTEFTRYFFAGSMTFLVDFLVLFFLTEVLAINYLWSNLAAVTVGMLMSYILCIRWVFNNRLYSKVVFEFPLFVATCIVGILLNELLLWACVEFGDIHYLVSKIVVTGAVFVVNFCLKKVLLFRR